MTSRQSNGSGPPTNVTVVVGEEKTTTPSNNSRNEIWTIVTREARAVSAWAVLAPLMRLLFAPLVARACVGSHETCPSSNIFSVVAGWILCFFPKSVAQDMAPGFMFASAWLLFAVRDSFGIVPNVPLRICEMIMGRLTLKDLCIVLPVHFLCTLSTFTILNLLLPSNAAEIALAQISYSEASSWLVDFIREMAVNCAFTVAFLVVPEIFALNKVPRFVTTLVMYPLYSFGVDTSGKGGVFGPNVLFALAAIGGRAANDEQQGLGQASWRLVGVMLGGVVGGFIMKRYFPDNSRK